jgi:hypothetical protein
MQPSLVLLELNTLSGNGRAKKQGSQAKLGGKNFEVAGQPTLRSYGLQPDFQGVHLSDKTIDIWRERELGLVQAGRKV